MSAHTKGPWIAKPLGDRIWIGPPKASSPDDVRQVVTSLDGNDGYSDRARASAAANAALIAAAPDLLTALEEAVHVIEAYVGPVYWEAYRDYSPEMLRIRAAIAKARGEASS